MDRSKTRDQPHGSAAAPDPNAKAAREKQCETISSENPGGFKNDPDDPTSPNEAIERSRRKLRPSPMPAPSEAKKGSD
jgi:hypothetical protein